MPIELSSKLYEREELQNKRFKELFYKGRDIIRLDQKKIDTRELYAVLLIRGTLDGRTENPIEETEFSKITYSEFMFIRMAAIISPSFNARKLSPYTNSFKIGTDFKTNRPVYNFNLHSSKK